MSSENDEISATEMNAAPPRKRVSIVWRYFEKLHRSRVKCKLCRHEQNYQGTTGNILRHLKNKHQIDATVRGQQDVPTTQATRIRQPIYVMDEGKHVEDAYEIIVKTEKNDSLTNTRQQRDAKAKVVSYCEQEDDSDIDPYAEGNNLDEYIVKHNESATGNNGANATTQMQTHNSNIDNNHNTKHSRTTAQEERILAEIEYFREKAAYYRMQKNLTALQAKKVKYELEQLG